MKRLLENRSKNLCILLFVLLLSINSLAQNLPEIIPPGPEAASLIKYSQMDVSLYTGKPNISVPFHTISFQGAEVPISIGYNVDGIKVGDIASSVGLGWSLNTGGLVSRSIRGLPDDAAFGYMNTVYTVEDLFQRDPNDMNETGQTFQLSVHQAHQRDYEPDIFNFSFPGGSGQFFYDQTKNEFVQTPYSNLKIETKLNGNGIIIGLVITDSFGVRYYFGTSVDLTREGLEQVVGAKTVTLTRNGFYESDPSVYGTPNVYYQSWMLMDIVFPTSTEKITFDYTTETNVETNQLQNEEFIRGGVGSCPDEYNIIYVNRKFTQPKLSTITFPNGKIVFENSSVKRTDLRNSYPLKKIKLLDLDNILIKGMELHTSYFVSNINTNSTFDTYNEGIYRLKLDSISQFGKDLEKLPPYKFKYNSIKLPDRFARSQDYFGYYNGKNNTTLIPRASYYELPGYLGDADRAVDPSFTTAGALEKIFYPTGGYDEFIWENNSISFFSGNPTYYTDYLTQSSIYFSNDLSLFADSDPNIDYSTTFVIPPNSNGIVEFNVSMSGCPDPLNFNNTNCHFVLKIIGVTNPNFLVNVQNSKFNYTFPAGTYKIIANSENPLGCNPMTDPTCTNPESFGMHLKWMSDPTPGEYIYGGLRIKQINTFDDPTSLALSRNFKYSFFANNPNLSSGVALNFVDLSMRNYRGACYSGSPQIRIVSNSPSQMTPTKGSLVGYRNVTESYSGVNGNGRKEFTFTPPMERSDNLFSGIGYYDSPFPSNFRTPIYNDWVAGNLENLEVYDASNNLVQKVINEYETAHTFHAQYYGIQILRMPPYSNVEDNFYATTYHYSTEWHRLKKTIKTDFFSGVPVVATNEFLYHNNPLLASHTKSTTSNGNKIISKTFYPGDIDNSSSLEYDVLTTPELNAIRKMKKASTENPTGLHRIATVVQTETTVKNSNDDILSHSVQRTNYSEPYPGLVMPKDIQVFKGTYKPNAPNRNILEDRIIYHSYYPNGNVREVSRADGIKTVYIWGYDGQYPIAKIEHATFTAGQPTSITLAQQSLINAAVSAADSDVSGGTEDTLRIRLRELREGFPDAMVTTYTYDPLVGMTSMTDPKGQNVYYEYDEFSRLKQVKDAEDNIITKNGYHYKQ